MYSKVETGTRPTAIECVYLQLYTGYHFGFHFKSLSVSPGVRVDLKVPHSEGICGLPMVLQQISKILNHSATNKGSVKTGE